MTLSESNSNDFEGCYAHFQSEFKARREAEDDTLYALSEKTLTVLF